jgi:hypothetical protein
MLSKNANLNAKLIYIFDIPMFKALHLNIISQNYMTKVSISTMKTIVNLIMKITLGIQIAMGLYYNFHRGFQYNKTGCPSPLSFLK